MERDRPIDGGRRRAADRHGARRQAALLRKRFERIKERLRVLATEAGLLSDA